MIKNSWRLPLSCLEKADARLEINGVKDKVSEIAGFHPS